MKNSDLKFYKLEFFFTLFTLHKDFKIIEASQFLKRQLAGLL